MKSEVLTLELPKALYGHYLLTVPSMPQAFALVKPSVWEVLPEHHQVKNLQFSSSLSLWNPETQEL